MEVVKQGFRPSRAYNSLAYFACHSGPLLRTRRLKSSLKPKAGLQNGDALMQVTKTKADVLVF